jgi:hypothetical protein
MKIASLITIIFLASACGNPKKHSSGKVNQIFVKGDPLTMVTGTVKDSNSFVTYNNFMDFRDYALSSLQIFAEKEILSNEQVESIESGNEAEEKDLTAEAPDLFRFKYINAKEYDFVNADSTIALTFDRQTTSNKMNLTQLRLVNTVYDVAVEHYSLSADRTKMSFLFRLKDKRYGSVLMSAVFYKYNLQKSSIPKTSRILKYIYGPCVIVPWKLAADKKVKISVCPNAVGFVSIEQIRSAFEKWEEPFSYLPRKLDIEVNPVASCKPFSDVNESALHYVSEYLTIPEQEYLNPGFALINGDMSAGYIFDADIVLLGSEIKKSPAFKFNGGLDRTLTHEFGHYLGLDHMFDGHESVMSYKRVMELKSYDKTAIRELYRQQL